MGVRSEAERVVRSSWREIHDEDIAFMAGSIAYHAFISMLPLVVFLLFILSVVGNEAFTAKLVEVTEQFLTPYARDLLVDSLDVTSAQTSVSVIGAITLLWGISKIFRSLDIAFSRIYNSDREKTVLDKVENVIVVFFALTVAVLVFLVAGAVFALFSDLPYPAVWNTLLLIGGLAIAFFPIYYVFPDTDVTPKEVLPGVVIAAVGWSVLEAVFQGYVAYAGRYEAVYGTLGSVFILLIWLYFSGLILLVGGVVNAVVAGRTGDENALDEPLVESAKDGRQERANGGTADGGSPINRDALQRTRRRVGRDSERFGRVSEEPDRDTDRLDADGRRLERKVERLAAENDRLKRENAKLTRKLERRRSIWERAKQWLFGE
jgi:membrane protein